MRQLIAKIMAPERKVVLCSIALIGVTLPISYYFYKKWKRNKLYKYIESIQTYKSPNSQTIQVVDENAIKHILDLADEFKILAIDAEWVQKGMNKIALLQISFPNGKCFLINHRQKLPDKFLAMLENGSILKIGIGILDEGPDHIILTGHQVTNLVSNFEYLLLLCFLTSAEF